MKSICSYRDKLKESSVNDYLCILRTSCFKPLYYFLLKFLSWSLQHKMPQCFYVKPLSFRQNRIDLGVCNQFVIIPINNTVVYGC